MTKNSSSSVKNYQSESVIKKIYETFFQGNVDNLTISVLGGGLKNAVYLLDDGKEKVVLKIAPKDETKMISADRNILWWEARMLKLMNEYDIPTPKFIAYDDSGNLYPVETPQEQEIIEELKEKAFKNYDEKAKEIGEEQLSELERVVMLKVVDQKWMDHIDSMDELKDGIGLRAYGQKDPVVQYRIEGFDMFDEMVNSIKRDVVKILLNINRAQNLERKQTVKITKQGLQEAAEGLRKDMPKESKETTHTPVVNNGPSIGRNDPCTCGSGKKYKNCCGK